MTPVPPPVASPTPKDEVRDTPTGRFEIKIKKEFKAEKIYNTAVAIIALLLSLGALFAGYRVLLGDARAQTKDQVDSGLNAQQLQIDSVKRGQALLEENQKVVLVEVREMRLDVKELYKSQRFDRPSPRLEATLPPLPPLKTLDGGQ